MTESLTEEAVVLVVGATGSVGSHTLKALMGRRAAGAPVRLVAACRTPDRLPADFDGEVRAGDLRDADYLRGLFEGVDVACVAAAWSSLYGHADASRRLFREPVEAALNAAEAAGVKRVLLTSAIDVKNVATSRSRAIRERLPEVWPHLANVVALERELEAMAERGVTSVAMRCGFFVGPGTAIGIMPVLLPRLRARMVPMLGGGDVPMRFVDVRDIGEAFAVAALAPALEGRVSLDVVGDDAPTFRELCGFLHAEYGYPLPLFGVSFDAAYRFAWLAEKLAAITPFEPLITRSIVFLSEPAELDTQLLHTLGFRPRHHWRDAIREQIEEIERRRIGSRMVDRALPEASA